MKTYLPANDIKFAEKYLASRDFESLQLLISSALSKANRELKKETPKKEYLDLDLEKLETLKAEVDMYCLQLGIEEYE